MNIEKIKREHYEGESTPDSTYERVMRDGRKVFRSFKIFVLSYLPLIGVLFTGIFGILEAIGVGTGIPDHLVGYSVYWGYGTWGGLLPAALIHQYITNDDNPRVFTYDVEASLLSKLNFPKGKLEHDTTIMSPDGEDMDIGDLDRIRTKKHGECYLALGYDRQADLLITSWFAGMNPIELRAKKKQLGKALTVMWKLVDAAVSVVGNRQDIARESAYREVLQSIELEESLFLESATEQTAVEEALTNSGFENEVIEQIKDEYEKRDDWTDAVDEDGGVL